MDAERLGQQLRTAREALELTIEDVEQALRIRRRFLEAFETGAYEDLPGAVQARGFLRNYARFLRLDEDSILDEYDAIQQALPADRRTPTVPRVATVPPPVTPGPVPSDAGQSMVGAGPRYTRRPRWMVYGGVLAGLMLLLGLCFGGTRLVERLLNTQAGNTIDLVSVLPTVPSLTPSATFLPSATPLPGARVIVGATPITGRVVLQIDVVQRTFIRVTVDGTVAFEGIVRPGTQLEYQAQQTLNIQASSGAGLDVVFNNLPLGLLGARGEAVDRTFTPDMALTPTVPVLPTATATLTPPPTSEVGGREVTTDAGMVATSDAADAQAGPAQNVPTALPLPDTARDVTGGGLPATLPPVGVESPAAPGATSQPTLPQTQFDLPTASVTPAPSATSTFTPSQTVTPSPTVSPTPTAVLPPRQTNTPIPQKQG